MITISLTSNQIPAFKQKALVWAQKFDTFIYLENNGINYPEDPFINVLAIGNPTNEGLKNQRELETSLQKNLDWHFGFISYDFKNNLENLESNHPDHFQFPNVYFFKPSILIFFENDSIRIETELNGTTIFEEIQETKVIWVETMPVVLQPSLSKDSYLDRVETIKSHILKGDIYEMNFCMEFYAEGNINPWQSYLKLNQISPMPFSAFSKFEGKYILCASPERFLKKEGNKLISQPIKGTTKRSSDLLEDKLLAQTLSTSEKERSENIMIVDLVRNDLSRTAENGTVRVSELCKVYTFTAVHQLISTVTSSLSSEFTGFQAICKSFPMGSMTGAPKINALKFAETFENFRRGIYSGSIGYFSPDENFDFNVVIRSIIYDSESQRISCPVGSAITYYCDSEKEYEECLLKVETMKKALE